MRTHLNFNALKGLDDAAKRREVFKAVCFALAMSSICLDVAGEKAAYAREGGQGAVGVQNLAGTKFAMPDLKAFEAALARKYATPDQNPILTDPARKVESFFHSNMPEMDLGYLALFDLVDMRGTGQSEFDINTTGAGITWTQRKPGAPADIRRIVSESQVTVPFLEMAAGMGILDVWLQFNKFWKVEEVVAEFLATAADTKAGTHYGLFTAQGAGIDTAFATDDTTTFNAAAATMLRALRGTGSAPSSNAQFDILCNPEKIGRILAMLDAKRGSPMIAFGTQNQPIAFNVRNVISSTHVAAGDTGYYLILPGRKNKRGQWKDLTLESQREIAVSTTDWVGVEQYNAAVADTNQVRRVKYA